MPPKVLPTVFDIKFLETELMARGFEKVPSGEVLSELSKRGEAPRVRHGRELGLRFSQNGLTVYVWTTWLESGKVARDEDAGWVLIVDDRKRARYFAHPIHRTKNFIRNLCRKAWIAAWKVQHRPPCPQCGRPMEIAHGRRSADKPRKSRSTFWVCRNSVKHTSKQPVYRGWDEGLPPNALKLAKKFRKNYQCHLKRNPNARDSRTLRHPWRNAETQANP